MDSHINTLYSMYSTIFILQCRCSMYMWKQLSQLHAIMFITDTYRSYMCIESFNYACCLSCEHYEPRANKSICFTDSLARLKSFRPHSTFLPQYSEAYDQHQHAIITSGTSTQNTNIHFAGQWNAMEKWEVSPWLVGKWKHLRNVPGTHKSTCVKKPHAQNERPK